jgi:hypothetical protein
MNSSDPIQRLSRREAVKWLLAATGSVSLLHHKSLARADAPVGKGYGMDPNLIEGAVPWERTMSDDQLKLTAVLADIILPHVDTTSPSASEVHVPDFIDEWISAPYPDQQRDRKIVLGGLAWMDAESTRRFDKTFVELKPPEALAICDDICHPAKVAAKHAEGARFFTVFRGLTLGGYYTTAIGMKDAGYVGNVALASFDGPPPEVLKRLGIERAPW